MHYDDRDELPVFDMKIKGKLCPFNSANFLAIGLYINEIVLRVYVFVISKIIK